MILGLTGGIASGKSTVAEFFREKKIPIICADTIAREITEKQEILDKISVEFGKEMSSIKIYENKTFKLNNVLKYELHSADENVKALHRVGTVCRREWQK